MLHYLFHVDTHERKIIPAEQIGGLWLRDLHENLCWAPGEIKSHSGSPANEARIGLRPRFFPKLFVRIKCRTAIVH